MSKTEDVMKSFTDQHVKNVIKLMIERVGSFVTPMKEDSMSSGEQPVDAKSSEAFATEICAKEEEQCSKAVEILPLSKNTSIDKKEDESEVLRMIHEDLPKNDEEDFPLENRFPETQKQITIVLGDEAMKRPKRMKESSSSDNTAVKKLKYESPLEFLRLPKNKYDCQYNAPEYFLLISFDFIEYEFPEPLRKRAKPAGLAKVLEKQCCW